MNNTNLIYILITIVLCILFTLYLNRVLYKSVQLSTENTQPNKFPPAVSKTPAVSKPPSKSPVIPPSKPLAKPPSIPPAVTPQPPLEPSFVPFINMFDAVQSIKNECSSNQAAWYGPLQDLSIDPKCICESNQTRSSKTMNGITYYKCELNQN